MKTERPAEWHEERARLLQEACTEFSRQVAAGSKALYAAKRISAAYHGRKLSPTRRLRIAPRTLLRIWHQWKKDGCSPSSFDLASRFTDRKAKQLTPAEEEKQTALKIPEAAFVMGMTPHKVGVLIDEGKLLAIDISRKSPDDPTSRKRHLRVPFRSIEQYFAERGETIPLAVGCLKSHLRTDQNTSTLTVDNKVKT